MGNSESKTENKAVDTNGNVNNNVVIQEPIPVTNNFTFAIWIICGIKIIELFIYIYKFHQRNLKKKYVNANNQTRNGNV